MHKTSSSQQFVYSATIEGSPAKPWAGCAGGCARQEGAGLRWAGLQHVLLPP